MKFEQLLQVYWSKGFLYGGRVRSFDISVKDLFEDLPGMSRFSKNLFIRRFELGAFYKKEESLKITRLDFRKVINMYLSQIASINNNVKELTKFNIIRLYLIKSHRGRAQAMGKPSRGQRTWSNAWNAYRCNRILRLFISEVKRNNVVKQAPVVLNLKFIKRKVKKTPIKIKMQVVKKKINLWF